MTILYSVLSIFPIIDVPSWQLFAVKVSGVVIGANLLGVRVVETGGFNDSDPLKGELGSDSNCAQMLQFESDPNC